jgi:hypothetical protein
MKQDYKYDIRICETCKNEFRPFQEAQTHCSMQCRMVTSKCVQCKVEFSHFYKRKRKFCSRFCSNENIQKNKNANLKIIICTNCGIDVQIRKTNTHTKYCSRKCKDLYQRILFANEGNPNFGNSKLKGIPRTPEMVEKIRIGVTNTWKDPMRLIKHTVARERYKLKYGYYPMHSPESRAKSAKSYLKALMEGRVRTVTHGKSGYYTSTKTGIQEHHQSSYELFRMKELDNDDTVNYWTKKHHICISLGPNRHYLPDFLIEYVDGTTTIEEVKGYVRDKDLFALQTEKANLYIIENDIDNYRINYMKHLKTPWRKLK